jgi:chromosome segregation ATPase
VGSNYGLEKLSHLEDKLYRAVDQFKRERQERDLLEQEVESLRRELGQAGSERERLERQIEGLLSERDEIKAKVEAMLEAIAILEVEAAEVAE